MQQSTNVVSIANTKDDVPKLLEAITEDASKLLPLLVEHVAKEDGKATCSIKLEMCYNDAGEVETKITTGSSFALEPRKLKGEILEGNLRLWEV
jgi:hypothetical protein